MTMRRASTLLVCALVFGSIAALAQTGKKPDRIVAVLHPTNPSLELSDADMKNIFLGRKKTWSDGTPLRPFMRPHQRPAGHELLRAILKMTPARFRQHWAALELSGQGTTPKALATPSEVAARVGAAKGGISFVTEAEASALGTQVKVVRIKY